VNCSRQIKDVLYNGMIDAALLGVKSSSKLLLILAAVGAFSLVQPVKADRTVQAGPHVERVESVPDGGSTVTLLGIALLGVAALRRKLSC
jgi:hypothetical protein